MGPCGSIWVHLGPYGFISRTCRARFPADLGKLRRFEFGRILVWTHPSLTLRRLRGITPRFARPERLASLGRSISLRSARLSSAGAHPRTTKRSTCQVAYHLIGHLGSTCPGSVWHKHKCAKGSLAKLFSSPDTPAQNYGRFASRWLHLTTFLSRS